MSAPGRTYEVGQEMEDRGRDLIRAVSEALQAVDALHALYPEASERHLSGVVGWLQEVEAALDRHPRYGGRPPSENPAQAIVREAYAPAFRRLCPE